MNFSLSCFLLKKERGPGKKEKRMSDEDELIAIRKQISELSLRENRLAKTAKWDTVLDQAASIIKSCGCSVKPKEKWGVYTEKDAEVFVSRENLGKTPLSRDDAFREFKTYFGTSSPDHGSYLATWASPGSGKSHFLSEIAHTLPNYEPPSPRCRYVPILVSFNGVFSGRVYETRGLVLRCIVSFICGVVDGVWKNCARVLDQQLSQNLSISDIIIAVAKIRRGAKVLFLVDELRKCTKETPDILTDVHREVRKEITDECQQGVKAIFSTLDHGLIDNNEGNTESDLRLRKWIELPPLDMVDVRKLARDLNNAAIVIPVLELAAGHPRTTGLVFSIAANNIGAQTAKLIQLVQAECPPRPLPWRILGSVLSGRPILALPNRRDTEDAYKLANEVSLAIANGSMYNSMAGENIHGVRILRPMMPLFLLIRYGFISEEERESLVCNEEFVTSSVKRNIAHAFDTIAQAVGENVGPAFEKIHGACVSALSVARYLERVSPLTKSLAYPKERRLFADIYKGAEFVYGDDPLVFDAMCSLRLVPNNGRYFRLNRTADEFHRNVVYVVGGTNVGFDIAQLFEVAPSHDAEIGTTNTGGEFHLLLTECRQSADTSGTRLCHEEVTNKINTIRTQLAGMEPTHPFRRASGVSFLMVARRPMWGNVLSEVKEYCENEAIPFAVAIMAVEQIRKVYSPTLVPLIDLVCGSIGDMNELEESDPTRIIDSVGSEEE